MNELKDRWVSTLFILLEFFLLSREIKLKKYITKTAFNAFMCCQQRKREDTSLILIQRQDSKSILHHLSCAIEKDDGGKEVASGTI